MKFWFSTLEFSKLQIFSLIWQSILKILKLLQKPARWKWSFCPPGKGLQGPSLMGHKSKRANCIRLKICILYTQTKINQWEIFQKNLRWWVTWVGWLDMELPELQRQTFDSYFWSCTEHKFFYRCYVMIDHHVNHIFYIFLLPLSSIASSGCHPIFTTDCTQKCEDKVKAKKFLFEIKRVSYSLVSYFLKLGIWLWTECVRLCIWNIILLLLTHFCFWVLQLITQALNVLVVHLHKPVIQKVNINHWGEP